jgi:hypothetical protein
MAKVLIKAHIIFAATEEVAANSFKNLKMDEEKFYPEWAILF